MKKNNKLLWQVLIAMVLGVLVGTFTGTERTFLGINLYTMYSNLGQLFINALMLVVVPLVTSSLIVSISKISGENGFGRLGLKTILVFLSLNFIAILVGLVVAAIFSSTLQASALSMKAMQGTGLLAPTTMSAYETGGGVWSIIMQIIPRNIIDAFAREQILGLIFFSILFGFAISKIENTLSNFMKNFWESIFQCMITITQFIMKALPYGVFFLVAKQFAKTGFGAFRSLSLFLMVVLISLAIYSLVVLPLFLRFVAKINPWSHFKAVFPALITGFSTSSSAATLPVTIDCVEKRIGVSNKVCSLVLPLGTTLNMSGTAMYAYLASILVAFAYGMDLSIAQLFFVALLALVASIGVAGVPSASIVTVVIILKSINVPVEGVALFLAVDRILDMFRTTANVLSDSASAVAVAALEGEKLFKGEKNALR
jgi:proton glutamate symport protein